MGLLTRPRNSPKIYNMNMPLDIQRSLVTACYITIMQYYPLRNKQPAARGYVKQSIKALKFIQKNAKKIGWKK